MSLRQRITSYKRTAKRRLQPYVRHACEAVGIDFFSHPALHDIDRKLLRYLPHRGGFFIEAGANNGYLQSNTYYLERLRGWSGILVEGIPELFHQCIRQRPSAHVFNCALVPHDFPHRTVTMKYANLMSLVDGALKSPEADQAHIARGVELQDINSYEVSVPARTLTSILDEVDPPSIDLLSLDVEGYELQVLKGLDFEVYRPRYMLIEARFREEIEQHIGTWYKPVDQFSHHDVLYKLVAE